jgi:ketosteroid isomerase-like protein
MDARNPEQVIELLSSAINEGDVTTAIGLYEPEARFAPEPGAIVTGQDEIQAALQRFAALSPTMRGEIENVIEAGGVALVCNRWSLSGTGPDGGTISLAGRSADVMRRQADGSWKIVIDDPWGGAS